MCISKSDYNSWILVLERNLTSRAVRCVLYGEAASGKKKIMKYDMDILAAQGALRYLLVLG